MIQPHLFLYSLYPQPQELAVLQDVPQDSPAARFDAILNPVPMGVFTNSTVIGFTLSYRSLFMTNVSP